ncbi:hypothetical protein RUND412_008574 [Rhizina undulata]
MEWFGHRNADGRVRRVRRERGGEGGGRDLNTRPTFGEWFRSVWLDIVTMVCMGAIGLGVYYAHPAPTRSFPVDFQNGEVVYPQYAYPLRKNIIPLWLAAFLASVIPIFVFAVMQIRVRSFWDLNSAVLGLLYSLINAAVFQVFLKWLIGGLRPHFLAVCQPNVPLAGPNTGDGFRQIMYTREICTGNRKEIDDALESFPSGHSTAAFAGFVFLYLYLNAKLKVFADRRADMWKLTVLYTPVLGAALIAGSLTVDKYHHWYDVFAGAIIGTIFAFSSFRMVYASIWDFRFNHVPLPRGMGFRYDDAESFGNAGFTRKAAAVDAVRGPPGTGVETGFGGRRMMAGGLGGDVGVV